MGHHIHNPTHHAAEALSAFFVGLLYFLVQWMWQMVNVKAGTALPVAYILFLATAISGAFSFHALLMYGGWPPIRMRIVNVFLFLPFLLVGLFSYDKARERMMILDTTFGGKNWYEQADFVIAAGVLVGFVPLLASFVLNRLVSADSSGPQKIDA